MITIEKQTDYSVFKIIKGNRAINSAHKNRLKDAISQDASCTKYNPIIVNERFEVIDGQHRLAAISELGLPVYYIKQDGLSLENVQALNSLTKPWGPMDYARSYSDLGRKNYRTYIVFKQTYHLNHDVLLSYLGLDEPNTGQMFKSGKLRVSDAEKSHDLASKLTEIGQFYPRYKKRSFALAFQELWGNKNYDHKRMMDKMKTQGEKMEDYSLPEDYSRALERVYNFHAVNGDRVRFY